MKKKLESRCNNDSRCYNDKEKNLHEQNESLKMEIENTKAQSYLKDKDIENLKSELCDLNKKLKVLDFSTFRLKIPALGITHLK